MILRDKDFKPICMQCKAPMDAVRTVCSVFCEGEYRYKIKQLRKERYERERQDRANDTMPGVQGVA